MIFYLFLGKLNYSKNNKSLEISNLENSKYKEKNVYKSSKEKDNFLDKKNIIRNLLSPNKNSFNGIKSIIVSSPKNKNKQLSLSKNSKVTDKFSINKLQKNSFSSVNNFFYILEQRFSKHKK
jgi:hypothetical protein